MKVEVTQEDINEAFTKRNDTDFILSHYCPISCAIRRITSSAYVSSNKNYIAFSSNNRIIKCLTPSNAQLFIDKFDNKLPVTPIEFDLDV